MPTPLSSSGPHHRVWDIGRGVHGYAWDAPEPRAVLLLQHGFGEYAERYVERYARLIPHLLDLGITVHGFDLEGHGRSPGRRALTDMDRAVADHLAARRKLAAQRLPVFLLGHSLGGIVTATSVVRDPAGVHGVVLSSPALLVSVNPLTRALARIAAVVAPALPARKLPPAGRSRLGSELAFAAGDPMIYQGAMPAKLAASILFTSRANWGSYGRWTAPTLVIHGSDDTFTEPEGSRRFIEAIGSSDKTLEVVEGGYHELLNDVDADQTLRIVLEWLSRRLPPM
jgi:acylglycerol lipase